MVKRRTVKTDVMTHMKYDIQGKTQRVKRTSVCTVGLGGGGQGKVRDEAGRLKRTLENQTCLCLQSFQQHKYQQLSFPKGDADNGTHLAKNVPVSLVNE